MAESPHHHHLLRLHELRLLRCSLPPQPPPPPPPPPSPLADLISAIESGRYLDALSSSATRAVFQLAGDSLHPAEFYSELETSLQSYFLTGSGGGDGDTSSRFLFVVAIAVSAFLAFVQCNLIGPVIELPLVPLPWKVVKEEEGKEWEAWARIQLMAAGSDLVAKLSNLQYIVFAKMLLMKTRDLLFREEATCAAGLWTSTWWLARLILVQQRILDERCSSLLDLAQVFMGESLERFGNVEKITSYWGALNEEEALTIVSMLQLEAGLIDHCFGRVDPARQHFESAALTVGLELSVTGALGFRTVHQVEPKAQMVLVANRSKLSMHSSSQSAAHSHEKNASIVEANSNEERDEVKGVSDVLMTPRIMNNGETEKDSTSVNQSGCANDVILTANQQAVVLSKCLLIEKSARLDELQRWEMAPYIEAIDSQQASCFSGWHQKHVTKEDNQLGRMRKPCIQNDFVIPLNPHLPENSQPNRFRSFILFTLKSYIGAVDVCRKVRCSCNILRIRWEATRSRTKERALLMMDTVVQEFYRSSPPVSERVHCCFGVYIPAVPVLRKEYGELLLSRGLIGEALKIFEDLELWDNLIYCYRLLEKKAAAVELIKARLLETPNDPRLWCSLGDITNDDACYEKALEVSNDRSARAKRSLARSAYNRGDYEQSKVLWESAMALNSLYPDGWFALGAAALKARDMNKALDGFTRAVQLDPDNGEAWNNIACLHMIRKKNEEAFIAFKEALKLKRNSWQMWENYGQVAADVGNFSQALEAARMLLDLSGNKRYDGEVLERIMQEMERRVSSQSSSVSSSNDDCTVQGVSGSELAESRETERLMELLGKVLQQIVRCVGGGDAWGLYARWHKLRGDLTMCSEALLKQVRSYQGSEVWKDVARFRKFALASLALCKVYMEISSSNGSLRELHAADMHLRNTIKQASAFSDTEELKALQACLDDVHARLEANPLTTS